MENIIASVLGGLVGGLFTFLGVLITINHDKQKERKEEMRILKEKDNQIEKDKPRLEIVAYEPDKNYDQSTEVDACVVLCKIENYQRETWPLFFYDPSLIKPENWVCVDYTFCNTGNTEIDHFYFSTNLPRYTALFGVYNGDYLMCYKNNYLNYSVILEKNVKPQQRFTLRVCYIRERIIASNMGSAPISVWMVDTNKNWWEQPLFAPNDKIYNSFKTSNAKFIKATDVQTAIKCFDNPDLW